MYSIWKLATQPGATERRLYSHADFTPAFGGVMDQRRPPVAAIRAIRYESAEPPSVTVVIPTLNEAKNLPHVFSRLPSGTLEVIVVDGGSVDDTVAVAKECRADVLVVNQ